MEPPTPPDAAREIEFVKSLVARHFPVYDVKVSYDVVQFFCRVDETMLEEHFDQMRQEMSSHGYIPMMTYDKGEHVVVVAKKPPSKHRSLYVNLALFIATFLTVTWVGMGYWSAYADTSAEDYYSLGNVGGSILAFTLPLMAILSVHELSHYFAARRRNVAASLPFFIPMPIMLGTFGAFISLREPVPNRKTMIEIGSAGPIGGLLMTIPLAIIGIMLTNSGAKPVPEDIGEGGLISLSFPYLYLWISQLLPTTGDYLLHPTAFAAWVGFFLTAINLLPAGQLDGGHIARALFGDYSKYVSWAAVLALIAMAVLFGWWGWMLFAFLILFLGVRHPPPLNDITRLGPKRKVLGVVMFVILGVTFVPVPLVYVLPDYSFELTAVDGANHTILPGESMLLEVYVESTGNVKSNVTFAKVTSPAGWLVLFGRPGESLSNYSESPAFEIEAGANATVNILVTASVDAIPERNYTLVVGAVAGDEEFERTLRYSFSVGYPSFTFSVYDPPLSISAGSNGFTTVQVNNSASVEGIILFKVGDLPAYFTAVLYDDDPYASGLTKEIEVVVPAESSSTFGIIVYVSPPAEIGEYSMLVDAYYLGALIGTIVVVVAVN